MLPREASQSADAGVSQSATVSDNKTVKIATQYVLSVLVREVELQYKIKQIEIEAKEREEIRKLQMERVRLENAEKIKALQLRPEIGTANSHTASSHTFPVSTP